MHISNALSSICRRHAYVAKSWPTLRVVVTQKRPRHTQFISITTNKYKSAQTYGYLSYHRVVVFELKQQSRNCRHVGNSPTCRQMSCRLDTLADTTFSCVCDMTETCRVADTTQNVAVWAKKRHADIRHVELRLPKISTVLQELEGFTFATALDLNMGYYTIRLDPDASRICTIIFHLPMGQVLL